MTLVFDAHESRAIGIINDIDPITAGTFYPCRCGHCPGDELGLYWTRWEAAQAVIELLSVSVAGRLH
jgi:hypothetical protein